MIKRLTWKEVPVGSKFKVYGNLYSVGFKLTEEYVCSDNNAEEAIKAISIIPNFPQTKTVDELLLLSTEEIIAYSTWLKIRKIEEWTCKSLNKRFFYLSSE